MITRRQWLGVSATGLVAGTMAFGTSLYLGSESRSSARPIAYQKFSELSSEDKAGILARFNLNFPQASKTKNSGVDALVAMDFELEQVYLLDGWVISETELALAMVEKRLPIK